MRNQVREGVLTLANKTVERGNLPERPEDPAGGMAGHVEDIVPADDSANIHVFVYCVDTDEQEAEGEGRVHPEGVSVRPLGASQDSEILRRTSGTRNDESGALHEPVKNKLCVPHSCQTHN